MDPSSLLSLTGVGGWVFAAIVLGLIIYSFLSGKIVAGGLLDRALNQQDQTLPALNALTSSTEKLLDTLGGVSSDMEDLRRDVETLRIQAGMPAREERPRERRRPA